MLSILTVAFMVTAGCASYTILQTNNYAAQQTRPPTQEIKKSQATNYRGTVSREAEKKVIPAEFQGIDFANLSYPVSNKKGTMRLKNGEYEFEKDAALGNGWLKFQGVNYSDLTGDGKSEAIVELSLVSCGVSCDGGSALFYFYSIKGGQLRLQSRLETGSLGYECGLKSLSLKKQILTLETFRACTFNGVSVRPAHHDADETGGKFLTNRFTRFVLQFKGSRLVKKKQEVFPYPEDDFRGFKPKIEINND